MGVSFVISGGSVRRHRGGAGGGHRHGAGGGEAQAEGGGRLVRPAAARPQAQAGGEGPAGQAQAGPAPGAARPHRHPRSSSPPRPRGSWPRPATSARSRASPTASPTARAGGREQEIETIIEPRFVDGCRAPEIPEALHSTAATIEIDVRMLIDEFGRVTTATLLTKHPLIPDDLILECARAQVFKPAHLPDGTAVPYPFRRRFVFKPAGSLTKGNREHALQFDRALGGDEQPGPPGGHRADHPGAGLHGRHRRPHHPARSAPTGAAASSRARPGRCWPRATCRARWRWPARISAATWPASSAPASRPTSTACRRGLDRPKAAELAARALERKSENLSDSLQKGLNILASTGSTAPFIGLLGTVLGILNAFKLVGPAGLGRHRHHRRRHRRGAGRHRLRPDGRHPLGVAVQLAEHAHRPLRGRAGPRPPRAGRSPGRRRAATTTSDPTTRAPPVSAKTAVAAGRLPRLSADPRWPGFRQARPPAPGPGRS